MVKGINIKDFKGLTQDSRGVKTGYLFAAFAGSKTDGRRYISDAIRNGATGVLAATGTELPSDVETDQVTLITDDNPRHAFALLAAEFYEQQPEHIVAVTGTNGKTSTVDFVKQFWRSQDIKAASIGTLGVRMSGTVRSGSMTTPDPVSLHAALADMAASGITHLAMEASSHGLDQCRLDGVRVKASGFTNLSRDHLDYHGDMEAYFEAKLRLFTEIMDPEGMAVLNADCAQYEALRDHSQGRGAHVLSYGYKGEDLKVLDTTPSPQGQVVKAEILGDPVDFTLPLVGGFQVMNALCALGLVLAENPEEASDFIGVFENLQGVPGRLELVREKPGKAAIYIDYAHTPDALASVLKALRPHTQGRLVCLFGCGGDRDMGKRPLMGQIAGDLADHVVVTDDNPRTEDPAGIRRDIMASVQGAQEIGGRREAIWTAVKDLHDGDVLVIAGKGHEQGQVFADRTEPFDDYEEAEKAVKELK